MTLQEAQSILWPRANYAPSLMVAGALGKAKKDYGVHEGVVLDFGALRADPTTDEVQIFTPAGWVKFDQGNRRHLTQANAYSRVGPGWSYGNNSVHNHARIWFEQVYGRKPTERESFDLQYNGNWFNELKAKAAAGVTEERPPDTTPVPVPVPRPTPPTPTPAPTPQPIPPKPSPPPILPIPSPPVKPILPPVSTTASLTPANTRVEELRTIAQQVGVPDSIAHFLSDHAWRLTKPLFVDLLKTYRLMRKTAGDSREIPTEDKD